MSRAAVNEKFLGAKKTQRKTCGSDQVLRRVPRQYKHQLLCHCSSTRRSLDLGFEIVTRYHNTWNFNKGRFLAVLRCFLETMIPVVLDSIQLQTLLETSIASSAHWYPKFYSDPELWEAFVEAQHVRTSLVASHNKIGIYTLRWSFNTTDWAQSDPQSESLWCLDCGGRSYSLKQHLL